MHVGASWKQRPAAGPFDVIVIGSGIGGLACASALARYGKKKVLVLERHYRIGGYTHTFTRPGYEWDVGVHYLGQLGEKGAIRAVFDHLTDGSLQWARLPDVYDRILLGERSYDFVARSDAFIEKLTSYFPNEREVIAQYVELCRKVTRAGQTFYLDRALPTWVSGLSGRLLRRKFQGYAGRTTAEVLHGLTKNEELISVLTGQYGDYGLPPSRSSFVMHAALVAHYLGGAWYPVGGSAAIARAFAPVIEAAGGALRHSVEVEQVVVEGGRAVGVRLAGGAELRAPLIVSDAGAANTFGKLIPEALVPAPFREALRTVTPSVGYLCLYLGFKHTDEQLGLTGTNLWIYPDGDHDQNIERFVADPSRPLPVVYVSFPSAKDPSWSARFPGRATIDVITLCPWEWVDQWKDTRWLKRGPEYEAFKAKFTERLLEVIFRVLPQLKGKVDVAELSTPLSTRHFAAHPRGELYGLDHSPARYRVPLRAQTPVPGLLLTGADLTSAGVAGAMMGGVLTASAIEGIGVLRSVTRRD